MGKTSLTIQFCNNTFSPNYKQTLGVDFFTKKVYIKEANREVSYLIWDTAGQEYYDSITRRYYKGADAAVLVFSITDRNSYIKIPYWHEKIKNECGSIPVLLAMNKIDIEKGREVTIKETFEFAYSMNLELILTSCKNNTRVSELFEKLAAMYLKDHCIIEEDEEYEDDSDQRKSGNNNTLRTVKDAPPKTPKSMNVESFAEMQAKDNLKSFKLKIIKYENKNIDNNKKNTKHYKKCC